MSDWVPASRRTKIYVWVASALWLVSVVLGFASRTLNDAPYLGAHALMFILLIASWLITLWSALQCRNPRLRLGWLLVATGQITSLSTSLYMVVMSTTPSHPPFDSAAPFLTVAFSLVGVGLWVGASSIRGEGERLMPFLQSMVLSAFMFAVMTAALLAPGPTMPMAVGPRDITAVSRLAIDCGFIFFAGAYAMLLQLRLEDGHRARLWMWAAISALVAAMGDVTAPLVDLGHGQIFAELLWCLGDVLLAVGACLAADFELARASADPAAGPAERPVELAERVAESARRTAAGV